MNELPTHAPEPDEHEMKYAMYRGLLPACPFCGSDPLLLSWQNENTKIWRVIVSCSNDIRCGCQIGSNSLDKAEARERAIKHWKRRQK